MLATGHADSPAAAARSPFSSTLGYGCLMWSKNQCKSTLVDSRGRFPALIVTCPACSSCLKVSTASELPCSVCDARGGAPAEVAPWSLSVKGRGGCAVRAIASAALSAESLAVHGARMRFRLLRRGLDRCASPVCMKAVVISACYGGCFALCAVPYCFDGPAAAPYCVIFAC